MWSSKKIDLQTDFEAGVYLSGAPSPPRCLFGMVSNFVGSESGQIQS
jgi:hypothetical protein